MRVDVDPSGMLRKLRKVGVDVQGALDRTAVELEDRIEASTAKHAKTGWIERSIFKQRTQGGWELGHDLQVAPHARFVHDGTRPHVILPNKRKMLRWPVPARPVTSSDRGPGFAFARKVHHPGYKGDAWLDRAASQAPEIFKRHVHAVLASQEK